MTGRRSMSARIRHAADAALPAERGRRHQRDTGVTMRKEVGQIVGDSAPLVRLVTSRLDEVLISLGCSAYVKTIYVGYEIEGQMVAVVYPHTSWVEVALALGADHGGEKIVDATHLTWPTLPVAVEVRSEAQLSSTVALAQVAAERVRSGAPEVKRPPEFFLQRQRKSTWNAARRPE